MFATLTKFTISAGIALTILAAPAGPGLTGEMGATYDDGPYSFLPEALTAHADGPAPDLAPAPAEQTPEDPTLLAMLMDRIIR